MKPASFRMRFYYLTARGRTQALHTVVAAAEQYCAQDVDSQMQPSICFFGRFATALVQRAYTIFNVELRILPNPHCDPNVYEKNSRCSHCTRSHSGSPAGKVLLSSSSLSEDRGCAKRDGFQRRTELSITGQNVCTQQRCFGIVRGIGISTANPSVNTTALIHRHAMSIVDARPSGRRNKELTRGRSAPYTPFALARSLLRPSPGGTGPTTNYHSSSLGNSTRCYVGRGCTSSDRGTEM